MGLFNIIYKLMSCSNRANFEPAEMPSKKSNTTLNIDFILPFGIYVRCTSTGSSSTPYGNPPFSDSIKGFIIGTVL